MRHGIVGQSLGRSKDHSRSLRRNLVKELFDHERIQTTRAKAEAARGFAEELITLAKRGKVKGEVQAIHARRLAIARLGDSDAVKKLFDEIAPRYENRQGGYTRIVKMGPRLGDAADIVLLELVED